MGVDVTPATGSDFTSRKSVVNIAPRHWRLGTTGICHTGGELCQLSFGDGAAGILRCRYIYRMGGAAARAAGGSTRGRYPRLARLKETGEFEGLHRYRRIGRPYPGAARALAQRSRLWGDLVPK